MARTAEQNERIRKNTQTKIHSVAIECFSQNGFGKTTMQELAKQAGMSVGSLYRHYKTKEELFAALVDEATESQKLLISKIESYPPEEAIRWLANEVTTDFSRGLAFSHLMKIMLENPGTKQIEANNQIISSIANVIEQGQKDGAFIDGVPMQLAQFLVSIVQGLCSMQLLLQDKFMLPKPEQIISFLKKGE